MLATTPPRAMLLLPLALLLLDGPAQADPGEGGAPSGKAALGGSGRLLLVTTDGWQATRGTLRLLRRTSRGFVAEGAPIAVVVGRGGMGWARDQAPPGAPESDPRKREGDGRAPAGLFPLEEVTGYRAAPPTGARMPYRQADERLRCVDDPAAPAYNRLVAAPAAGPPPWASAEAMRREDGQYEWTVVVGHNRAPTRAGDGSCIFLHVADPTGAPTSGCTAMARGDLLRVLRFLDPRARPLLVQGPREALDALQRSGRLPSLPR